jgi:methionyl-tRNA formyltransferase
MVAAPSLSIVFFGTPAFAAPTLRALLESRHRVVGAVCQPDRPSGRGQKPGVGPVKALALDARLPVLQPERLKDPAFLAAFAALGADLGVVAAYGRIIPEVVIDTPRFGLINVHASLLPRCRGAAPIQRAVMAGDTETGVTIMRIVKALDAGPMLARVVRPIPFEATSGDVERDLAAAGARLLVDVVDTIAAGTAREEPQDDAQATYAPKITREESAIDWRQPAVAIHNQVRGLNPWPHASASLEGARIIVARALPENPSRGFRLQAEESSGVHRPAGAGHLPAEAGSHGTETAAASRGMDSGDSPGTIIEAAGDAIRVATGDGILRILQLQPEGRRVMTAREFLAGRDVRPGMRFA